MKTHELARILLQYDDVDIVTNVGYTSMMAEDVLLNASMLKLQCLQDNNKKPEGVTGEHWLLIGGLSA